MTGKEVDNKILSLKEKAGKAPIATSKIDIAKNISIKNFTSKKDLFEMLCSFNLLNAAIKMSYYREELTYKFIKGNVSRVLTSLISMDLQEKYGSHVYISHERVVYTNDEFLL